MKEYFERVKKRIGIKDNLQDSVLESIIENVISELIARLPIEYIPNNLKFIVIEISTKRYNRIGAEGMLSENIEGRSSTYEQKDFEPYEELLNRLYPKDLRRKGNVTFY